MPSFHIRFRAFHSAYIEVNIVRRRTLSNLIMLFACFLCCSLITLPQQKQPTVEKKDSLEQAKPEKKRTIYDWRREQAARDSAERSLPIHLMRMGPYLRDLVHRMKAAGITQSNAKIRNAQKRFSTNYMFVDSLGRITIDADFRHLDRTTVDQWRSWGVEVKYLTYPKNSVSNEIVVELKSNGTITDMVNSKRYPTVECLVPYDVVEEFAKDTSMLQMESLFPTPILGPVIIDSKQPK